MSSPQPKLTLEVIGDLGSRLRDRRKSFGPAGGTIGRSPQNHWVLDDDYVSRQHARVSYAKGEFFIEDSKSKGGVSVNDRALTAGEPCPLASGDRVEIKPYSIEVIEVVEPGLTDSTAFNPNRPRRSPSEPKQDEVSLFSDSLVESLKALFPPSDKGSGSTSAKRKRNLRRVADSSPETVEIPPLRKQAPPSKSTVELSPPVARGGPLDLEQILAGAGLEGSRISPEVAHQLGQIIHAFVAGILELLDTRRQAKEAFRVPGTTLRARGNNPLKYSTDVTDALHNLFVQRSAGNLAPVEAVEEAFADLRHHQLAVTVGMNAAFQAVLERFEPNELEERFNQAGKGSVGAFFGEIFGEAYQRELQRLREELRVSESNKPG